MAHGSIDSPKPGGDLAGPRRDLWFQVAALAGAATLPLALGASVISDVAGSGGLNPGSSDAQLLLVFSEFRGDQLLAAALLVMAAVATLVFLGPLWARLRVGSEAIGVVAVGGGVTAAVLWLAAAGWSLTAAVAADFQDAGAARFLMVSAWEMSRLSVAPYLVMIGAATAAGIRHRVFGRWFNAVGVVFTLLLLIGLLPASPAGLMGMLSTLWVFCASLVIAFAAPPTPALRTR
jgi:hypothetical protein